MRAHLSSYDVLLYILNVYISRYCCSLPRFPSSTEEDTRTAMGGLQGKGPAHLTPYWQWWSRRWSHSFVKVLCFCRLQLKRSLLGHVIIKGIPQAVSSGFKREADTNQESPINHQSRITDAQSLIRWIHVLIMGASGAYTWCVVKGRKDPCTCGRRWTKAPPPTKGYGIAT